jgi:hypothetical protein
MKSPTAENKVVSASPDEVVTLWRGTRPETAQRIHATRTAGGYDTSLTPGLEPGAPSEDAAIAQVVGASGQGFSGRTRLPEYTTSEHWAMNYANGAIVCIDIRRKFLTKGSGSEGGWVMFPEAPIEAFAAKPHTGTKKVTVVLNKQGKHLLAD